MSTTDFYHSSERMARVLSSYMNCPERIRSEILTYFPTAPQVDVIAGFRQEHLNYRPEQPEAFKPHDGYYPGDAYDAAEVANARFVDALLTARAA
jgi:hypothetical protein